MRKIREKLFDTKGKRILAAVLAALVLCALVTTAAYYLRFPKFEYYSKPYFDLYVAKDSGAVRSQVVITRISSQKSPIKNGEYFIGSELAATGKNTAALNGTHVTVTQMPIRDAVPSGLYDDLVWAENYVYGDGQSENIKASLAQKWRLAPYINTGYLLTMNIVVSGENVTDNIVIESLTMQDVEFTFDHFNIIPVELPDLPGYEDAVVPTGLGLYHPLYFFDGTATIWTSFEPKAALEKAEVIPLNPDYVMVTKENFEEYKDRLYNPVSEYAAIEQQPVTFSVGEASSIIGRIVNTAITGKEALKYDSVVVAFAVRLYLEDGTITQYYDTTTECAGPEYTLFRVYHDLIS
ncbi:MAG: hypothetical protein LBQ91_06900 [Oscillospiraceae bacterium]|jgi:hypothetical protein|nr:hypothetical protein [Oscillospiraceae bacterium]